MPVLCKPLDRNNFSEVSDEDYHDEYSEDEYPDYRQTHPDDDVREEHEEGMDEVKRISVVRSRRKRLPDCETARRDMEQRFKDDNMGHDDDDYIEEVEDDAGGFHGDFG